MIFDIKINKKIEVNPKNVIGNIEFTDSTESEPDAIKFSLLDKEKIIKTNQKISLKVKTEKIKMNFGDFYINKINHDIITDIIGINASSASNWNKPQTRCFQGYSLKTIVSKIAKEQGLKYKCNININMGFQNQKNENNYKFLSKITKRINAGFAIRNDTLLVLKKDSLKQNIIEIDPKDRDMLSCTITENDKKKYKSVKVSYRNTKTNKTISVVVGKGEPQVKKMITAKTKSQARKKAQSFLEALKGEHFEGSASFRKKIFFAGQIVTLKLPEYKNKHFQVDSVNHTISHTYKEDYEWNINFSFKQIKL